MNNRIQDRISTGNLRGKVSGRYLRTAIMSSQLWASLVVLITGGTYVYFTAGLSNNQLRLFFVISLALILIANIIHFGYLLLATQKLRSELDSSLEPNRQTPAGDLHIWDDLLSLPNRYWISQFLCIAIVLVIPLILVLRNNLSQAISVSVGGLLATAGGMLIGYFHLGEKLETVRYIYFPDESYPTDASMGFGINGRAQAISQLAAFTVILTISLLSYQQALALSQTGSDAVSILAQFRSSLIVVGFIFLVFVGLLTYRISNGIVRKNKNISDVLGQINAGQFGQRLGFLPSDETKSVIIQINEVLDGYQSSHGAIEQQVHDQMSIIENKNKNLQLVTKIIKEFSDSQGLQSFLDYVVDQISSALGVEHAAISTIDETGEFVVLRSASSEGGKKLLAQGFQLRVGQQGIQGSVAYQNRPIIAMDVTREVAYASDPNLPSTRSEAAFPLVANGKVIGVFDVQSSRTSAFMQDDIEFLNSIANFLGLVLQNNFLQLEMTEVMEKITSTTKLDVRHAWEDYQNKTNKSYRFTSLGSVIQTQAEDYTRNAGSPTEELLVPIFLRGQQIGEVSLRRRSGSSWSETERVLVSEITNQAGLALENARLLEDTQRHVAQEQTLGDFTTRLGQFLDPDMIMQTAVRELHKLPNVEGVSVFLSPEKSSDSNPANDK